MEDLSASLRARALSDVAPASAVDSTQLETGFMRSPRSRTCAASLVGALGVAGIVRCAVRGLHAPPGCAPGLQLAVFWSLAPGFGTVMFAGYGFLKMNGAFTVYALLERSCASLAWLWCCFGCATYFRLINARYHGCLGGESVVLHTFAVVVCLMCLLLLPLVVVYCDLQHRERLRDPKESALLWDQVTAGLRTLDEVPSQYRALPKNVHLPPEFACGVGSTKGNNCWISSLVQLVRGAPDAGFLHDAECASIRDQGVHAGVWAASPDHIAAGIEAIEMVCHALQCEHVPNVVILAGLRADLRQEVLSNPANRTVCMFNPVGMHFDPLWPAPGLTAEAGWHVELPLLQS